MRRSIARVGPGRVKSPVGTHTEGFRPPYLLGRCCYLRARNAATVRLLITDLRRLDIRLGAWQLHVTVLKIREHRERNRRLLVAASVCMDAPPPTTPDDHEFITTPGFPTANGVQRGTDRSGTWVDYAYAPNMEFCEFRHVHGAPAPFRAAHPTAC